MFRAGVRAELGDAVEVVGEADEVDAAIELINERVPDVVLLDVHLPGGGGQAVIKGVHAASSRGRSSSPSRSPTPPRTSSPSSGPGARGYITKTISGEELLQAVYRVGAGDAVFSPRLAGFVLDAFSHDPRRPTSPPTAPTPSWISSRPGNAKCSASLPAATPTRRWPGT